MASQSSAKNGLSWDDRVEFLKLYNTQSKSLSGYANL
jgi:hypothetical protein